ncbi:MAG: signal peptidase I [Proteobacteria bacterium]|nr:signal peptidase I [Pseudomonadota bacterium]
MLNQTTYIRLWRDWRGFVLFVAVMLLFRSAIADWNQVPSGSMIPSILVGDRIVVDKLAYSLRVPFTLQNVVSWHQPERGDVVTFNSPADERLLVKRIIGVPGDVVELRDNHLIVNGKPAHYDEVDRSELAALAFTDNVHYQVYRESVLGSSRLVMRSRMARPAVQTSFSATEVPADHYLMMGDNRDNSSDSRIIGFVSRDRILGKASTIAFSLDYDNYYAPRLDRFFEDLP